MEFLSYHPTVLEVIGLIIIFNVIISILDFIGNVLFNIWFPEYKK